MGGRMDSQRMKKGHGREEGRVSQEGNAKAHLPGIVSAQRDIRNVKRCLGMKGQRSEQWGKKN